jgi:hypothetical protein
VDATHRDTGEVLKTGYNGTERVTVVWIAMQRLGVQRELAVLGRGDRCDNRDLAAELIGRPGLAFADALHLWGMQRIDLGTPLTLLLVADPMGEIEQRTKAILDRGIAFDLASDIADDTAEPGAQEFEFSPGELERKRSFDHTLRRYR